MQRLRKQRESLVAVQFPSCERTLANVEEDLQFVLKTANLLMSLVNQKYGAQLHPLKIFAPPAIPDVQA
jgi:hypothetical protein